MEIVRRIVLVVGIGAALWLALVPARERVVIGPQDFEADQARRPAWSGDRKLPIEEFIRKRTEGRTVHVSGDDWSKVADAVDALARGEGVPGASPGPIGERFGSRAFYVAPGTPFLGEVGRRLGEAQPFLYVRLEDEGAPRWLTAMWLSGSESGGIEPASVFKPHRHLWPWILLATFAFYVLLPRPKRRPDTLRSDPRSSVVVPDAIGAAVFAAFFGLSLLIASDMAATGQPLDAGWRVPTLILWGFSFFGLSILAVAAHYATLRFRLLPDRVERISLRGTTACPYGAIRSVEVATKQPPKALGCLGAVVGLFDWRALGPTMLAASRGSTVLEVRCEGGTTWRISLDALEEADRLVEALRAKRAVQ